MRDAPDLLAELVDARAAILSLATGLDPSIPQRHRFEAAVERRVARSPIPIDVEIEPLPLSEQWQHTLLLVFSETVANAVKHARCTRITVRLTGTVAGFALRIADDGVGSANPTGFGLRGLRDRVGALGGTLEVVSPQGGGTTVCVTSRRAPGAAVPGPAALSERHA